MAEEPPLYHVLHAQQFDRELLDGLCDLTTRIREVYKTRRGAKALRELFDDKEAILYFTQPSTRTFISFAKACRRLGIGVDEIRDPSTSSEVKGESPLDSIRTFASYADVIVMRSPHAGLAEKAVTHLDQTPRPVPIINAGSGKDQHPTQAFLDVYTLERSFKKTGGIDGKTIALVGDLKRGRTVRSLAYLIKHYKGVRLILVSPLAFRMEDDILEFLRNHEIPFEETYNFDQAVAEADAVYMTRIQDEHDRESSESAKIDISRFCFAEKHLKILKPQSIVMHPLPRRNELAATCDKDPRVMIWRQERNGMWVRTALLYTVLRGEHPKTILKENVLQ
jgi:aspartate carbamoyltransferase catalytic subunit